MLTPELKNLCKKMLSPYKDNFIYIDFDSINLDFVNKAISGHINFRIPAYLNFTTSTIFCGPEAIFASHQISLLLTLTYLQENMSNDKILQLREEFNDIAVRHVLKKQSLECLKLVDTSTKSTTFNARLLNHRVTSKGYLFIEIEVIMGDENNFKSHIDAFIFNKDVHSEAVVHKNNAISPQV